MNDEQLSPVTSTSPDRSRLAFLAGFLQKPQQVGSVIPSSRHLERRVIEAANLSDARLVVELGPGTGGTTRAILRHLRPDAHLMTIEMNARFVQLISAIDDPRLINWHGSAEHLAGFLNRSGLGSPDVVISGIPFSTMPRQTGRNIVCAIHDRLADDGRFVAYQLSRRVADLMTPIMGRPDAGLVILNIPPMRVYRWQKAD